MTFPIQIRCLPRFAVVIKLTYSITDPAVTVDGGDGSRRPGKTLAPQSSIGTRTKRTNLAETIPHFLVRYCKIFTQHSAADEPTFSQTFAFTFSAKLYVLYRSAPPYLSRAYPRTSVYTYTHLPGDINFFFIFYFNFKSGTFTSKYSGLFFPPRRYIYIYIH